MPLTPAPFEVRFTIPVDVANPASLWGASRALVLFSAVGVILIVGVAVFGVINLMLAG